MHDLIDHAPEFLDDSFGSFCKDSQTYCLKQIRFRHGISFTVLDCTWESKDIRRIYEIPKCRVTRSHIQFPHQRNLVGVPCTFGERLIEHMFNINEFGGGNPRHKTLGRDNKSFETTTIRCLEMRPNHTIWTEISFLYNQKNWPLEKKMYSNC